jgi:hypothetical protein
MIQEQEVLALDVEYKRLGIGRFMAEDFRAEETKEEEARVASFRRDAGHARNVDVRTSPTIQKREIEIDGKSVTREPSGEPLLHAIEMKREVTVSASNPEHSIARPRRHPGLRLHSGRDDPRAARNFERQHTLIGKENITFETAALVLGAH